jgi:hypothetical protein
MQRRGLLLRLLRFFLLFQFGAAKAADEADTRLLRQPAVSKDHLAFSLWRRHLDQRSRWRPPDSSERTGRISNVR